MKKILLTAFVAVALVACNKDKDTQPTTQPTTNNDTTNKDTATKDTSNIAAGNWKVNNYDGLALTAPAAGTLKMVSTSPTTGTADLDITFDGSNHNTEQATYTLSNNNTTIAFSKTGGSFGVLSGGGNWTINTLNATTFKMTSSRGLIIECSK